MDFLKSKNETKENNIRWDTIRIKLDRGGGGQYFTLLDNDLIISSWEETFVSIPLMVALSTFCTNWVSMS